jgi:hypothetical protein
MKLTDGKTELKGKNDFYRKVVVSECRNSHKFAKRLSHVLVNGIFLSYRVRWAYATFSCSILADLQVDLGWPLEGLGMTVAVDKVVQAGGRYD